MTPIFSKQNERDHSLANLKTIGNFPLSETRSIFSDPNNIVLFQFGKPMMRAFGFIASTLFKHVTHVVLRSAKKKMFWIDACSNITSVQDKKTFRNISILDQPRQSMSPVDHTINHHTTVTTSASFGWCTLPQPTSFGLFDFFEKSLLPFHRQVLAEGGY